MEILRTPDERFAALPGYPFEPRYVEVDGLRMHYLDEGPRDSPPVLLLHGEPSWCYLYRKMIPGLVAAGNRVIAPDFVGFGRSDKPAAIDDHSYARHVEWTRLLLVRLALRDITLFGQDWGSLIGLRLAMENQDLFARIAIGNGGLLTGDQQMPEIWHMFKKHVLESPVLKVGSLVASGCVTPMPDEVKSAYDAPYPSEEFKAGPRAMPALVPITPDDPAAEANRAAVAELRKWSKPFVTLFGEADLITRGAEEALQAIVPGAKDQPHELIEGASHFLQEDKGEVVADKLAAWIAQS